MDFSGFWVILVDLNGFGWILVDFEWILMDVECILVDFGGIWWNLNVF